MTTILKIGELPIQVHPVIGILIGALCVAGIIWALSSIYWNMGRLYEEWKYRTR